MGMDLGNLSASVGLDTNAFVAAIGQACNALNQLNATAKS